MTTNDPLQGTRWLLLIHQLPAKPAYSRVKVWRRLQALGAVAVKNAVYALPANAETRRISRGSPRRSSRAAARPWSARRARSTGSPIASCGRCSTRRATRTTTVSPRRRASWRRRSGRRCPTTRWPRSRPGGAARKQLDASRGHRLLRRRRARDRRKVWSRLEARLQQEKPWHERTDAGPGAARASRLKGRRMGDARRACRSTASPRPG